MSRLPFLPAFSLQFEARGYRNELEQSERPEGPYVTEFDNISEVHDYADHGYRSAIEQMVAPIFQASQTTIVVGDVAMLEQGGHQFPASVDELVNTREKLALSPEHILLTALDAADLHSEPDATVQSVRQNVVAFTLDGAPVRIFLNAYTHLPTEIDYSGPLAQAGFWRFLGDTTMSIYPSLWWLAKGGLHYPMQINVERNGLPDSMLVITKLSVNGEIDPALLTISPEVAAKFKPNAKPRSLEDFPLGMPDQAAKEVAPGILLIPGAWNATFIRQDDGIVILEAPISSGYSAKVIAEAERRNPGVPIKAVITTSDSWPHLAGIREYVARKIPIYALDLNHPILERVIAARHTTTPDLLQRAPQKPVFHLVREKTVLGKGDNRLEIYPIRGETSERQMMVYFPAHRLLYGSDPFQRDETGKYFYPQTMTELTDAVAREHLPVDQFFMMHIALTPWTEVGKVISEAETKDSPTGKLD